MNVTTILVLIYVPLNYYEYRNVVISAWNTRVDVNYAYNYNTVNGPNITASDDVLNGNGIVHTYSEGTNWFLDEDIPLNLCSNYDISMFILNTYLVKKIKGK